MDVILFQQLVMLLVKAPVSLLCKSVTLVAVPLLTAGVRDLVQVTTTSDTSHSCSPLTKDNRCHLSLLFLEMVQFTSFRYQGCTSTRVEDTGYCCITVVINNELTSLPVTCTLKWLCFLSDWDTSQPKHQWSSCGGGDSVPISTLDPAASAVTHKSLSLVTKLASPWLL